MWMEEALLQGLIAILDDYVFELPLRDIQGALFVEPVLGIIFFHLDGLRLLQRIAQCHNERDLKSLRNVEELSQLLPVD